MNMKRSFDVAASGTGIVVAAIPVLCAAFTMAVVNRSSPFFTQERVGKDGKPFKIYKIKSMNDNRDEQGRLLPDEERVTKLGILLRKSRLDELPQLLNVFMGDMSIVGPRPVATYLKELANDKKRHAVLPGLTGTAQLENKNTLTNEQWLALDHEYVDSHSLWNDIKIITKTPYKLWENRRTPHNNTKGQESLRPVQME
jgi:lipopolysaccharide/colanic/teichoic acid biosynthesis glycosyltransferase